MAPLRLIASAGALQPASARRRLDGSYRAAFESTPFGMAFIDRLGQVIESNARFRDLLGLEGDDDAGLTLADVTLPNHPASEREPWTDLLAGRRDSCEIEAVFRRRGGQDFCGRVTASALADTHDAAALWILEDLTARQQLEQQLRQSQKMDALGRLAAGVAHDFNNLLTVISGYAHGLLEDLPDDDERRPDVDAIRSAAVRAASLTSQLLAFGRPQPVAARAINVDELVHDVEGLLRRVLPESIDLQVAVAPDTGAVHADPSQLEQVLLNLALNARDAMPGGGALRIRAEHLVAPTSSPEGGRPGRPGSYVRVTVSDTGSGMDEATRQRIFEPFFTTKEHGRGSGLGLATVFGIVQACGGQIATQSELGVGTTFTVDLPRLARLATVASEPVSIHAQGRSPRGTGTVLLVEDQPAVRELLAAALTRAGYDVLEASDGEEAVALAERCGRDITVLVTDIVMPRLGGRELFVRLSVSRPTLRVLFMSGYADQRTEQELHRPGAAFLGKPFSPGQLTVALRALLEGGSAAPRT